MSCAFVISGGLPSADPPVPLSAICLGPAFFDTVSSGSSTLACKCLKMSSRGRSVLVLREHLSLHWMLLWGPLGPAPGFQRCVMRGSTAPVPQRGLYSSAMSSLQCCTHAGTALRDASPDVDASSDDCRSLSSHCPTTETTHRACNRHIQGSIS